LMALCTVSLPSLAGAAATPDSFADLSERLSGAVVNISSSKTVENQGLDGFRGKMLDGLPEGHPLEKFNQFFEKFTSKNNEKGAKKPNKKREKKATSLGSGFLIDPAGYVVTNNHVIDGAEEIEVIFGDDSKYLAKVIGRDSKTDLALLKIEGKEPFPFVKFGDSDASRIGDWILVIGNPFGFGGSVSAGIISARGRDINSGPFDDYLQTDAAINRGNSGGPMFNMEGEVIGINTAIFSPNGAGNIGIGFAVPTTTAKPVIEQLKVSGTVERGWLGVQIQFVNEDIADGLGLKKAHGALVADVMKGSPAKEGEVEVGDLIIEFDGKKVTEMKKLPRFVAETPVGKTVDVIVLRDGDKVKLRIQIARLEEDESEDVPELDEPPLESEVQEEPVLGMYLAPLDKKLRKRFGIDAETEGLIVKNVESDEIAAERGIRKGDVILEINKRDAEDVDVLEKQIKRAKRIKRRSVLLLIQRGFDKLFIAVPIPIE
jgi:serine protease Do